MASSGADVRAASPHRICRSPSTLARAQRFSSARGAPSGGRDRTWARSVVARPWETSGWGASRSTVRRSSTRVTPSVSSFVHTVFRSRWRGLHQDSGRARAPADHRRDHDVGVHARTGLLPAPSAPTRSHGISGLLLTRGRAEDPSPPRVAGRSGVRCSIGKGSSVGIIAAMCRFGSMRRRLFGRLPVPSKPRGSPSRPSTHDVRGIRRLRSHRGLLSCRFLGPARHRLPGVVYPRACTPAGPARGSWRTVPQRALRREIGRAHV